MAFDSLRRLLAVWSSWRHIPPVLFCVWGGLGRVMLPAAPQAAPSPMPITHETALPHTRGGHPSSAVVAATGRQIAPSSCAAEDHLPTTQVRRQVPAGILLLVHRTALPSKSLRNPCLHTSSIYVGAHEPWERRSAGRGGHNPPDCQRPPAAPAAIACRRRTRREQ